MKNQLEVDKTYLQSDDAVYGYFFAIYNALFLYYKILSMLKENGLNDKYSVRDVLLIFSKVRLVDFGHRKQLTEIPHKVEKLAKAMGLDLEDIFPIKLRS